MGGVYWNTGKTRMAKVPVATEKPPYDPIPKIVERQPGEKRWQFESRMQEHQLKKGSRYVAMNIEPLVWERQRLATPMTAEDRFLRKQWLKDQVLAPDEPRFIAASSPKNVFRRFFAVPGAWFQNTVTKLTGSPMAGFMVKDTGKKLGLMYLGLMFIYIYAQNKENTWEGANGIYVRGKRIPRLPGEDTSNFPKDPDRFFMQGFDKRPNAQ